MSVRAQAAVDLLEILNDTEDGGDLIRITSPAGAFEDFRALSSDIHLSFDPGTGEAISGRQCSVAVAISELIAADFEDVEGVADRTGKPWLVDANDVNGRASTFKVVEAHPDYTVGLMLLMLELYKAT
jgi:hypothetical protein